MSPNQPQKAVTEPEIQEQIAVFASLLVAATNHVSRQPSNSRGRKGTSQGPFRIQASDRREVWRPILHHQRGWQGCSSISLRGMAADRGEAGKALELQSYEEEVFEPHQLLRPGGRDGWPGTAVDSGAVARIRRDQRGSGGCRKSDLSGSTEHRALSKGYRREPVHG